jgi:hypothetical protein
VKEVEVRVDVRKELLPEMVEGLVREELAKRQPRSGWDPVLFESVVKVCVTVVSILLSRWLEEALSRPQEPKEPDPGPK